jgi:hypothetical protein
VNAIIFSKMRRGKTDPQTSTARSFALLLGES